MSLEIGLGETVGLIGHNGSGQEHAAQGHRRHHPGDGGIVDRRGRLAALLELGAGFHPDLTGRENVYLNASILGLSTADTDAVFDAIVEFSGIGEFIDTQVKFYSSGMYVRLAFAVAVHVDPDLLLVDEVLAVGDEPFQRKCMNKIRQFQKEGRTIVLVSHSSDQVADVCTAPWCSTPAASCTTAPSARASGCSATATSATVLPARRPSRVRSTIPPWRSRR